jgi:hypothetical protein
MNGSLPAVKTKKAVNRASKNRSQLRRFFSNVGGYAVGATYAIVAAPVNTLRTLRLLPQRKSAVPKPEMFEEEILHHSDALWQEFKLDTPIESLRMWKRNAPPLTSVVYMKFCGFFPNVKPETLLPLLSEPTRRGWDPNYEVFDVVERKNDGSNIVYAKSVVPKWLQYFSVKPRDYVQHISTLTLRCKEAPSRYFVTHKSVPHPDAPERADTVRGKVHFQGCLLEAAVVNDVEGTRVTVMSVNDIKLPSQLYKFVTTVMKRYPIKWYKHLATAVGCETRKPWRPSPISWLSDSEYLALCYQPSV